MSVSTANLVVLPVSPGCTPSPFYLDTYSQQNTVYVPYTLGPGNVSPYMDFVDGID